MAVTITRVNREAEPVIQNLVQLYTYDFTEFWAGTHRGDLLPDGKFDGYPLERYWGEPNWLAMLIWCDGILAGFALVNDIGHSGEPVDHNMAEFFVLRKYRGLGVARAAAEFVFSDYPGLWEVAVARKNLRAYAFWSGVINGSGKATDIYEPEENIEHWNGPIIRFRWD